MFERLSRNQKPVLIQVLALAGWLLNSTARAQWATDWQMCEGAQLEKFIDWDNVFAKAAPPEIDAHEWRLCPKPRTVGWSIIHPAGRDPLPASLHYFRTILMYPEKGRNCRLVVWGVKGGIEVTIVNGVHPLGKTLARFLGDRGRLAKDEAEELELTPHLRSGYSRIIIAHNTQRWTTNSYPTWTWSSTPSYTYRTTVRYVRIR